MTKQMQSPGKVHPSLLKESFCRGVITMKNKFVIPLTLALLVGGCTTEKGCDAQTRDQVQQVQRFKVGTLESVRKVRIEGTKSQAMADAAAEEGYTREDGVEFSIKLEDGSYISIVQAASKEDEIKVGDKVRVIENGSLARVVRY
jgi:outer membrane lipoprotein SlyB